MLHVRDLWDTAELQTDPCEVEAAAAAGYASQPSRYRRTLVRLKLLSLHADVQRVLLLQTDPCEVEAYLGRVALFELDGVTDGPL